MKKAISILVFSICIFANNSVHAQSEGVPISALPAYTGNLSGIWIPVAAGATTKKIDAGQIAYTKMDSLYQRNDTLFGKKNNSSTEFFIKSDIEVLDNIGELKSIAAAPLVYNPMKNIYHVKGFYHPNDGGGGDFILMDTSGAASVNGMIIPAGSGQAFVRVKNGDYNLKWFGAIGGGLATFSTDSLAIRTAFAFLNTIKGSKKLYVPNTQYADGTRSFYGFSGTGLMQLNDIEIYGDGKGKSEIRNVSPLNSGLTPGAIFIGSNYETDSSKSPFSGLVKKYHMDTAFAGDTMLSFRDTWVGQGHDLYVGEIVAYGCYLFNKNSKASKPLYSFMECNQIKSLTPTQVVFNYPFSFDLKRDTSGEYPQLFNLNDKNGLLIRGGVPAYTTKGFSLHDMTITQAGVDELADTTISARLGGVFGVGGFYESRFYNLDIDAYSGIGGNLFTHVSWDNIKLRSEKKFMDFGYGSGPDNTISNSSYEFKESPASDYASGWFISNNGNHGFKVINIKATGNFRGSNFFTLTGVRNSELRNININFPQYNYDQPVFTIGNSDTFNTCTNLTIDNINVTYGAMGKGMQILGGGEGASISNVNISNIYLNGNMLYYTGATSFEFDAYGVTTNPKRQDQYTTNGSTYQCVSSTINAYGISVTTWRRISGTNEPLSPGTLTKLNGQGDAAINYYQTAIVPVSNPDALSISDIKGGLSIRNFNATRGRLYLDSVLNTNLIDITVGDSLFSVVSGRVYTGSRFRVNVPYTNYYNLPGGEINVIGGVSYLNGSPLGAPLPKGVNLTYTGTRTWDGTPPTGETNSYTWSQDANGKIDLWMAFSYTSSGASNTSLTLDWPTGVPLPLEPTALSSVLYAEACKIITGGSITNQTASFAHIKKISPGVYQIVVATGSLAAKVVIFHLSFLKQ